MKGKETVNGSGIFLGEHQGPGSRYNDDKLLGREESEKRESKSKLSETSG